MQAAKHDIILLVIVATIILLFLLSFIAAILFLYQKKNLLYLKNLETVRNEYDKNLMQIQLEIREQTFQEVSREIHDNIGLTLTLAKLQLNTIEQRNGFSHTGEIKSSIELISKSIVDLSDISKSFNSEEIGRQGIYNMLKNEKEKLERTGLYEVIFAEEGNVIHMDERRELILYRIAQEVLNNTLKHAAATCISITIAYRPQQFMLAISDNGRGFNLDQIEVQQPGRMNAGLKNIRTRALLLNGSYAIHSQAGAGTKISINVPYQ